MTPMETGSGVHLPKGGFGKDGAGIFLMESTTLKMNPALSLSVPNCLPNIFSNRSPICFLAR